MYVPSVPTKVTQQISGCAGTFGRLEIRAHRGWVIGRLQVSKHMQIIHLAEAQEKLTRYKSAEHCNGRHLDIQQKTQRK